MEVKIRARIDGAEVCLVPDSIAPSASIKASNSEIDFALWITTLTLAII
jgi:hypothetical protein